MALSQTQKTKIAALNVKGKSVKEIAKATGINREEIAEFVEERNRQIAALNASGKTVKEIVKETGANRVDVAAFVAERNRQKKEPAPAEAETSPKEKYLQEYNTSVSGVCQAEAIANLFHHAERACKSMISIYEAMTSEEHRAFDLGETYRDMLSVRNDLEKLMKAGERA